MADLGISKIAIEPVDSRRVALRAIAFKRMPENPPRNSRRHAADQIERRPTQRRV
jgi:hypothetical protein